MPDDLPPETGGDRDWHWRDQEPDEKPLLPETERRVRLVFLSLAVAALVGAIIGLATWLFSGQEPSYVLSLIVWEHKDPLYPPHSVALADSDAILEHFKHLQPEKVIHGKQSQALDNLKSELRKLADEKKGPIIVHISCQARTLGGTVYLLPSEANPDRPDTWLKLDTVLEYVSQCPAKNKLLVLDLAHPLADTRLGVVYDDVAEGVSKTLENHSSASLWVLNSCAPGQTALTSQNLGRSVFMHFLHQGLRGGADEWGPNGKPDKKIHVKELAAYVRHQTALWAENNHAAKQTPWLWGKGDDFPVVNLVARPPEKKLEYAKKDAKDGKDGAKAADKTEPKKDGKDDAKATDKNGTKKDGKDDAKTADKNGAKKDGKGEAKPTEKKEPPSNYAYPVKLKEAWELRDVLAAHRLPPAVLLPINVRLQRIERDWPTARHEKRVTREVDADLKALIKTMAGLKKRIDEIAAAPILRQPPSIAVAMTSHSRPDKDVVKMAERALKKVTPSAAKEMTPEEKKAEEMLRKQVEAELELLNKDQKELVQKAAVWLAAANDLGTPNREQMVFLHDQLVKKLKDEPIKEYVESVWLKRIKAFDADLRAMDNQAEWKWPAANVGQALRTLLASEALVALLAQDPELLPVLDRKLFDSADEHRRRGEKLLFREDPSHWEEAESKLAQAGRSYETMHATLKKVHSARKTQRQALVQLPGFFLWLTARGDFDAEIERAWIEAYDQMNKLMDRLAQINPQNASLIDDEDLARALRTLAELEQASLSLYTQGNKEQSAGDIAALQALRADTGLGAEQRAQLWRTVHELADELHVKSPPEENAVKDVALLPPPRTARTTQTAAARARAKLALDLLTFAKVPGIDEGRNRLAELGDNPAPQAWEKLGDSLRAAWRQLPANASPADCFKCFMPDIGDKLGVDPADIEPATKWSDEFKSWLRERYAAEAKFLAPNDRTASAFFTKLAEDLRP